MTPIDVVRFAAPGIDDDLAEHLLWGATGWPCFWATRPGETSVRCFWRQVWLAARYFRRGTLEDYIDYSWSPSRLLTERQPGDPRPPKATEGDR